MADPIVISYEYRSPTTMLVDEIHATARDKGVNFTPTGPHTGTFLVKKMWVTLLKGKYVVEPANGSDEGGTITIHLSEMPPFMSRGEIVKETLDKVRKIDDGTYATRRA